MSLLVLLALVALGMWFHQQQSALSPAVTAWDEAGVSAAKQPSVAAEADDAGLGHLQPDGYAVMSPPEHFTPENLYEKINGRAELYLPAGFLSLQTIRFASSANPGEWFELFVYDMNTPLQAFAVYSSQRREDALASDLTDFSYSTPNALFFAHGRFYVEILASSPSESVLAAMDTCARRFIVDTTERAGRIEELALFPPEGLVPDSVVLLIADGFGFEQFDYLFTATYESYGVAVQAFLTGRPTPGEAVALAAAYSEFLIDNGAVFQETNVSVPGALLYNLFGTYELVFSAGQFVAGVHEADSPEAAERMAAELYHRITRNR